MSKKTGVKSIVSPGNFIMVSVDGETYQITRDNKNFAKIEALVKRQKWDEVFNLLGAAKNVAVFTEGDIKYEGGQITYKGKPVDNYVAEKLIAMINEGKSDYQPLARFLDKLMQSQYDHVKQHLYKFLEYGQIPLTRDGCFLGYKSVRADYMDVHSGKYDNSPGSVVTMPRADVVSDPNQACSSGLHVGVKQYVSGFGGAKTVIVKVDPRNVISVPFDYGHQKMRTCEYYVVADYDSNKPLTSEVYDVTDEEVSKAQKKAAKVESYVSVNAGPLRGPDGRFIKKADAKKLAKKKGPTRGPDGKFVKKNVELPTTVVNTLREIVQSEPEPELEYDDDEYDRDERW